MRTTGKTASFDSGRGIHYGVELMCLLLQSLRCIGARLRGGVLAFCSYVAVFEFEATGQMQS